MAHRLNVELTDEDILLCSCCWHEQAFTDEALDLTEAIIRTYDDVFGGSGADLLVAVKLLELMGGGITGVERQRLKAIDFRGGSADGSGGFLAERDIQSASSVYSGIIAISDESIREARRWEQARVRIDLTRRLIDFHVHYYTYMEEYIEYTDTMSSSVHWEDLPAVNADADIFTGLYFDHIGMVRRIVQQYPNGFRLTGGDVIEWM